MGHKTHPYGFRLGIVKDWKAHWYAPNSSSYRALVTQDLRLRESIKNEYKAFSDAGIGLLQPWLDYTSRWLFNDAGDDDSQAKWDTVPGSAPPRVPWRRSSQTRRSTAASTPAAAISISRSRR